MFIQNLFAFISGHGVECAIIGGVIAIRIPCTLHTGTQFVTTYPVRTYNEAKRVLGY